MINSIFIFGAKYSYLMVVGIAAAWFLLQPMTTQKKILILICITVPLILIASGIAGRLYYNPRPFVLGSFEPLISHQANNGFPSHHTLLVSAVSAIVFIFSRRLGLLLWVLALFTGFSRVYAGVHHIIDVAGSILISISLVTLTYFLCAKRYKLYAKK